MEAIEVFHVFFKVCALVRGWEEESLSNEDVNEREQSAEDVNAALASAH